MTALEVINIVTKHIEDRKKKNAAFYTDLGSREHLHRMQEDAEILEYLERILEWRKNV